MNIVFNFIVLPAEYKNILSSVLVTIIEKSARGVFEIFLKFYFCIYSHNHSRHTVLNVPLTDFKDHLKSNIKQ